MSQLQTLDNKLQSRVKLLGLNTDDHFRGIERHALPYVNSARLNNRSPRLHLPGYIISGLLEPRAPT